MSNDKVPCEVIKDLLPLYVDSVCSDDSKVLVSEHLDKCEDCAKEYKSLMSDTVKVTSENKDEGESIKRIGKRLKKDRKKSAIKAVAITLATLFLIGVIFLPDIMIAFARNEYKHGRNPENGMQAIKMNIYNHQDGKIKVGRVKLNIPEKYSYLENGLHIEHTETGTYITLSAPNQLRTQTNQKIVVIDDNDIPYGDSFKLDFSSENSGGQNALSRYFDRIGARKLGFSENDYGEFMYYLMQNEPPEYSFFSSFGKKAAAFAYYDCWNYMVPIADVCFTFDTGLYKGYGFAIQNSIDNEFTDDEAANYTFTLYEKGITVMITGFTKAEAEYIMSSLVFE